MHGNTCFGPPQNSPYACLRAQSEGRTRLLPFDFYVRRARPLGASGSLGQGSGGHGPCPNPEAHKPCTKHEFLAPVTFSRRKKIYRYHIPHTTYRSTHCRGPPSSLLALLPQASPSWLAQAKARYGSQSRARPMPHLSLSMHSYPKQRNATPRAHLGASCPSHAFLSV